MLFIENVLSFLLQLAIVVFILGIVVTCFGAIWSFVKKYWLYLLIGITLWAYLFPSRKLAIFPRFAEQVADVVISAAPLIIGIYILYKCLTSRHGVLRFLGLLAVGVFVYIAFIR